MSGNVMAQKIVFARVCNGGNNNNLYWQIHANACIIVGNLKLYSKDADALPFFLLDSGILVASKTYSHVNANVPSTKDWSYFFTYQIICGIDTILASTDTLKIDDQKPDSTILDSVSIDPITNSVMLGWTSNKTPDFSSYYLYNYDRADPRLIENYKDTFYVDNSTINPKSKSLSYDITSSDSCDNRKEYGNYQHKTICLKGSIDTCENKISLNWNAYVGWPVRVYELYRRINGNTFQLVDSFASSVLSFNENINMVNTKVEYFVRARKLGVPHSSSSSNMSSLFNTGFSINPFDTKISYVSNNIGNNIEVKVERNPLSNYLSIDLYRISEAMFPVLAHSFASTESVYIDNDAINTLKHTYYLMSRNMCGIITDTSELSNNIVLKLSDLNSQLGLNWGPYFTWNTGVKEYIIYRSSGSTVAEASNFVALSNSAIDTIYIDDKGALGAYCYYINAIENAGSNTSQSNKVCYIKTGNIYYPNAIVPNGVNNIFNFIGDGIDLSKSSFQVYNRWGQLEYNTESMSLGWKGINNAGQDIPGDVLFFTAQIRQGTETVNIKGNITIIR